MQGWQDWRTFRGGRRPNGSSSKYWWFWKRIGYKILGYELWTFCLAHLKIAIFSKPFSTNFMTEFRKFTFDHSKFKTFRLEFRRETIKVVGLGLKNGTIPVFKSNLFSVTSTPFSAFQTLKVKSFSLSNDLTTVAYTTNRIIYK